MLLKKLSAHISIITFATTLFAFNNAHADHHSRGWTGINIAYYCEALAVYSAGWRRSYCEAWSPNSNLDELSVNAVQTGEYAYAVDCAESATNFGPFSDPQSYDDGEAGTTAIVDSDHFFSLSPDYGWYNIMNGSMQWSYITYTDDMGPGGSASLDPALWNVVGACY